MKVDAVPRSMAEVVTALGTRFIATVQMDGVEMVLVIGMHKEASKHGTASRIRNESGIIISHQVQHS